METKESNAKTVSIRIPFDLYIKWLNNAADKKMSVSEYILWMIYRNGNRVDEMEQKLDKNDGGTTEEKEKGGWFIMKGRKETMEYLKRVFDRKTDFFDLWENWDYMGERDVVHDQEHLATIRNVSKDLTYSKRNERFEIKFTEQGWKYIRDNQKDISIKY